MDDLIGRNITLDDGEYAIVDVRDVDGEDMVYAERIGVAASRIVLRVADIEGLLQATGNNAA